MPARPVGTPTRGTTHPNRLRRVDRWLTDTHRALLTSAADPLVVDLGFGASPVTTLELADRLAAVRGDVEVVGVEIDRERVAAAQRHAGGRVSFRHGGFELPLDGRRPVVVRAMNVLRQYDESTVVEAWRRLTAALAPGGVLVEGTCDELGRRAGWVTVTATGRPATLTLAAHLPGLDRPRELAERLPKALVHRNVPGEAVHELLAALDRAWDVAAPYAAFGPRQRWVTAVSALRDAGWPVRGSRAAARRGELTVDWAAVAPAGAAVAPAGAAGPAGAAAPPGTPPGRMPA